MLPAWKRLAVWFAVCAAVLVEAVTLHDPETADDIAEEGRFLLEAQIE